MKKMVATFVGIGVILLVIGIILLIIGGTSGWNVQYTDEAFASEGNVQRVELDVAAGVANVEFYDGENIEIAYQAHPKYGFTASQSANTVTLSHSHSGWFNWGWNFGRKAPVATVKIPKELKPELKINIGAGSIDIKSGEFKTLDINVSAGKLTMGETICTSADIDISAGSMEIRGLTCEGLNCDVSAGSATVSKIKCDKIDIDVSAGSVTFNVIGIKSEYNILVDKSAGSCNVTSQQGTDVNKTIDIDVSAGSVNVNFGLLL